VELGVEKFGVGRAVRSHVHRQPWTQIVQTGNGLALLESALRYHRRRRPVKMLLGVSPAKNEQFRLGLAGDHDTLVLHRRDDALRLGAEHRWEKGNNREGAVRADGLWGEHCSI